MKSLHLLLASLVLATGTTHAASYVYTANLTGAAEAPSNNSPATGFTTVTIDDVLNTMRVQVSFAGLLANTTAAHIHAATAVAFAGTAGVATQTPSFSGFPLGVTSGSMDTTFDMTLTSSFSAAFITANGGTPATAFVAIKNAADNGKAYLNIHTASPLGFPGGEIRGFLTPVPEPATASLVGAGCMMMGLIRRRQK